MIAPEAPAAWLIVIADQDANIVATELLDHFNDWLHSGGHQEWSCSRAARLATRGSHRRAASSRWGSGTEERGGYQRRLYAAVRNAITTTPS